VAKKPSVNLSRCGLLSENLQTVVTIKGRAQKGIMKAGNSALPYTKKSLEALAQTLKIHRAMVWLDPATNSIGIKQFTPQQGETNVKEQ
jgi:hypothetical protein